MIFIERHAQDRIFSGEVNASSSMSWLEQAMVGMRRGWRAYVRYRRLSRMSAEALQKRGLKRHQIGRHAFFSNDDL